MTFEFKAGPLPLTQLPNGVLRVAGTRVGFDLLIYAFQQGETVSFFYEFELLEDIEVPIGGVLIQNDKGVIVEAWHKVRVAGHVDAVLKAAAAL